MTVDSMNRAEGENSKKYIINAFHKTAVERPSIRKGREEEVVAKTRSAHGNTTIILLLHRTYRSRKARIGENIDRPYVR